MDPSAHPPLGAAAPKRSLLLAAVLALGLASTAPAQAPSPTGGTAPSSAPPAPAAASASTAAPVVDAATCATTCLGISRATVGSTVRVSGEGMDAVTQVVLLGRRGNRDDLTVPATPVSPTAAQFTVPSGARGGGVRVISADGTKSARSSARLDVRPAGAHDPGGPAVEAKALTRTLLFEGSRTAAVSFYVRGPAPVDVVVDVVRASDQTPVFHAVAAAVAPGTVQNVEWDGTVAGLAQPDGRYVFLVSAPAAGGARAAQAAAPSRQSFWLVHDVFPVAGPHTYGDPFGVRRSGHTHQGQDVLADCGTPLVAAHGGIVRYAGRQAAAGNFVVIHTDDGSGDNVYMHLRDPALVEKGDAVATGQQIGVVGETGDATACHLHFELWTPPGWYVGGHAVDPAPSLKAWDAAA